MTPGREELVAAKSVARLFRKYLTDIDAPVGNDKPYSVGTPGRNFTPLHCAVWNRDLEATEVLLKLGANPNAFDSQGRTPLHFVIEQDYFEASERAQLTQLLTAYGADPDARIDNPLLAVLTPGELAAEKGYKQLADLMRRAVNNSAFSSSR